MSICACENVDAPLFSDTMLVVPEAELDDDEAELDDDAAEYIGGPEAALKFAVAELELERLRREDDEDEHDGCSGGAGAAPALVRNHAAKSRNKAPEQAANTTAEEIRRGRLS
jgi:hypothetical protein